MLGRVSRVGVESPSDLTGILTMEAVGENLGGMPAGWHGAVESALCLVLVGIALEGKTADTPCFHFTKTVSAPPRHDMSSKPRETWRHEPLERPPKEAEEIKYVLLLRLLLRLRLPLLRSDAFFLKVLPLVGSWMLPSPVVEPEKEFDRCMLGW